MRLHLALAPAMACSGLSVMRYALARNQAPQRHDRSYHHRIIHEAHYADDQ
jgi:hypothetical protein